MLFVLLALLFDVTLILDLEGLLVLIQYFKVNFSMLL